MNELAIPKFLKNMKMSHKQENGFENRIVTGLITIIAYAENHGDIPAMLPRPRPNRIFIAPRSCSIFHKVSLYYYYLQKMNKMLCELVAEFE